MQRRTPNLTKLVSIIGDDMAVDKLVIQKICNLPGSSPVVDSSDSCLALLVPIPKELVEICHNNKDMYQNQHNFL